MENKNQTILEWYRKHMIKIDAPCGGNGGCGKCKVRFKSEAPDPTPREKELLMPEELEKNIRLACICKIPEDRMDTVELLGDFWKKEGIGNVIGSNKTKNYGNEFLNNPYREQDCGVVVDVGTTTLVMSLVSLLSEQTIETVMELNPQRMYGADVMTRIRAANEGCLEMLQTIVKKTLEEMFERLLKMCDIDVEQVKKIVIVGNTTMLHFLCGYSCAGLGRAPFTPVSLTMQKLSGKECEEKLATESMIYILPGISTFVGADIVAGIYACDMDLQEEAGMLVDIGTNGEMVIGCKEKFCVASTAAGPVFEGGTISCGMPAIAGAITHLKYQDERWEYICLGEKEPQGICGSGLIDLLAELYQNHFIDENGTLSDAYFENGCRIVNEPAVTILQSDIRELQMGKAAIRAGMELLKKRITPKYMYVAGAFGKELHLENAVTTGLFSAEDISCIKTVGNSALEGGKKFLFDKDGEVRLKKIVALAEEIVLARETEFEDLYICNMQFDN